MEHGVIPVLADLWPLLAATICVKWTFIKTLQCLESAVHLIVVKYISNYQYLHFRYASVKLPRLICRHCNAL